jgi:hypothetical protein
MFFIVNLILILLLSPFEIEAQTSSSIDTSETSYNEFSQVEFELHFKRRAFTSELYKVQELLSRKIKGNYTVKHISIYSYSSMEGDSTSNLLIRNQRAGGVFEMLVNILNYKFKYDIKTFDSWGLFKNDVERTAAFGYLKDWPKLKVYEFLQSEVNKKALEPILKNHRFVKVLVKYDRSARPRNDELNNLFNQNTPNQSFLNPNDISNNQSQKELLDSFFQEVFDFFDEKQIVSKSVKLPEIEAKEQIKENIKNTASENIIIQNSFDKTYHRELLDSFFQEVIKVIDEKEFNVTQEVAEVIQSDKNDINNSEAELIIPKKSPYKSNPELTSFRTKKDLVEKRLMKVNYDNDLMGKIEFLKEMANINKFYLNDTLNLYYEEVKRLYELDEETPEEGLKMAQIAVLRQDDEYAYKILDHYLFEQRNNPEYLTTMLYCGNNLEFKDEIKEDMKYVLKRLWKKFPDLYCSLFLDDQFNFSALYSIKIDNKRCKLCQSFGYNCD